MRYEGLQSDPSWAYAQADSEAARSRVSVGFSDTGRTASVLARAEALTKRGKVAVLWQIVKLLAVRFIRAESTVLHGRPKTELASSPGQGFLRQCPVIAFLALLGEPMSDCA